MVSQVMAFVSVNAGVLNKHGWCGSTAAALSSSLHVTRGCILRCERAVCVEDNSNASVLLLERVQAHRRVIFASVPSSGSSWLRSLVEFARGIASEHVYGLVGEPGTWHPRTLSFGRPCGTCSVQGELVRAATGNERVMIKTHFPFAQFNHGLDRQISIPALVGGVVKTVRSPNETRADCQRKNYAHVNAWSNEYFLKREHDFHKYWDGMADSHGLRVINVLFDRLSDPSYVLEILLELQGTFFPEITMERAQKAIKAFPHRASGTGHRAPGRTYSISGGRREAAHL